MICPKIRIKGEITGDEDLIIKGHVEGSVDLGSHSITVGPEGHVNASIVGRIVTIEGKVRGDVTAEEKIVLLSSASVEGNLIAPRVVLHDGAHLRGGIAAAGGSGRKSSTPGKGSGSRTGRSRSAQLVR